MTQSPDRTTGEVTQHCYRHPEREALIRCTRCDRPICPACMRPASVGFHCPDDAREGARSVRAPRSAVGATLRDHPPVVTITLVALNVIAYLVTGLTGGSSLLDPGAHPSRLFLDWQLFPQAVHDRHDYYQLITGAFLHLSPLHIIVNMISLVFVGPALEQLLGHWRYLAVYLISALGGSAAVYAFGPAFGYTVGASGAIFGLFGVALILVRKLGLDLQWLVGTLVLNFVITFSVAHISKLAHLGGFVTGLLAGLAIGGWPSVRRRIETRVQVAGLTGLLVLVAVVVGVRTATW